MFVVSNTPDPGTVATATTDFGRARRNDSNLEYGEPLAVRALLIHAVAENCPVNLGALTRRHLVIERVAKNGDVAIAASYVVPNVGGNDRALTFRVDVAILPGKAVRARFDGCGPSEKQWVVINYDFAEIE
jgi:hypothetical protein